MHGSICESQLPSSKSFTSFLQVSCLNNIINQPHIEFHLFFMANDDCLQFA